MQAFWLLAVLALAACQEALTPEEQAARDAYDVDQLEQIQESRRPMEQLELEEITADEIEKLARLGTGCSFRAMGSERPVLALAFEDVAYIKKDQELVRLAADKGSAEMPFGTRSNYDGTAYSLQLTRESDENTQAGPETVEWPAKLDIGDEMDRPIYLVKGFLQCGA